MEQIRRKALTELLQFTHQRRLSEKERFLTSGSKLNHRTSSSPGCASRMLKSMDLASTLAGVPVFKRSVSNPKATKDSVKPVDGASPAL